MTDSNARCDSRIARSWHRSSAIITIIDRVVARARVIGSAAKDLGPDVGSLIAPLDPTIDPSSTGQDLRAAADALIEEVRGGRLRYVALVATRDEAAA